MKSIKVILVGALLFLNGQLKSAYQALPLYGHYGDPYQFFSLFESKVFNELSNESLINLGSILVEKGIYQENPFQTFITAAGNNNHVRFSFALLGTKEAITQEIVPLPWNVCWHHWKFGQQDNRNENVSMGLFNPQGLGAAQDLPFNRLAGLSVNPHDAHLSPNNAHFISEVARQILSFFSGASSDGHNALNFTLIVNDNPPHTFQTSLLNKKGELLHRLRVFTDDEKIIAWAEVLLYYPGHFSQADKQTIVTAVETIIISYLYTQYEVLRHFRFENMQNIQTELELYGLVNFIPIFQTIDILKQGLFGQPAAQPPVDPIIPAVPVPAPADQIILFENEPGANPLLTDEQIRARFSITYQGITATDVDGNANTCVICQEDITEIGYPNQAQGHMCQLLPSTTLIHTDCLRQSITRGDTTNPGTREALSANIIRFYAPAGLEAVQQARTDDENIPRQVGGIVQELERLGAVPTNPDALAFFNLFINDGQDLHLTDENGLPREENEDIRGRFDLINQNLLIINNNIENYLIRNPLNAPFYRAFKRWFNALLDDQERNFSAIIQTITQAEGIQYFFNILNGTDQNYIDANEDEKNLILRRILIKLPMPLRIILFGDKYITVNQLIGNNEILFLLVQEIYRNQAQPIIEQRNAILNEERIAAEEAEARRIAEEAEARRIAALQAQQLSPELRTELNTFFNLNNFHSTYGTETIILNFNDEQIDQESINNLIEIFLENYEHFRNQINDNQRNQIVRLITTKMLSLR